MSDHDVLMSALVKIRAQLEAYVHEYDPAYGDDSLSYLEKLMVIASKFPEDDQ